VKLPSCINGLMIGLVAPRVAVRPRRLPAQPSSPAPPAGRLGSCPRCAAGWRFHGGKCYLFSTSRMNWAQSRDFCVSKGAHLLIVGSETEQTFISRNANERHWIGLSSAAAGGHWVWVDNTPVTGVRYGHVCCWMVLQLISVFHGAERGPVEKTAPLWTCPLAGCTSDAQHTTSSCVKL
uniref:C-type lectin domain-containing protein n=1 Tax=Scleropages formosus TaxID=113540 RepID=A0A8C9VZT5_SCLFO